MSKDDEKMIKAGQCYICKNGALLYSVKRIVTGKVVDVCYYCRELIKTKSK